MKKLLVRYQITLQPSTSPEVSRLENIKVLTNGVGTSYVGTGGGVSDFRFFFTFLNPLELFSMSPLDLGTFQKIQTT